MSWSHDDPTVTTHEGCYWKRSTKQGLALPAAQRILISQSYPEWSVDLGAPVVRVRSSIPATRR